MTWTNGNDVWTSPTAWTTNQSTGIDPVGLTNVTCSAGNVSNVTATCVGGTGGFPSTRDTARFTNDTSYTVTINSSTNVGIITFSNTTGVVTMNAGASTLTVTGRVGIADGGSTSTVLWAGGTLAVTGVVTTGDAGNIQIGNSTNSLGVLIVTNGAVVFGNGTPPSSSFRGFNVGGAGIGRLVISGTGVVTNRVGGIGTLTIAGTTTEKSQLIVTNGGKLFVSGETRMISNALAIVSGPTTVVSNTDGSAAGTGGFACGFGGGGGVVGGSSMLIVSNGATLWAQGTISCGRNSDFNTGIVVGAGSKLISGPAGNFLISITSGANNDLIVYDGGYIECGGPFFSIPGGALSPNSSLHMGGAGAMSTGFAHEVRINSGGESAALVVTNAVFTASRVNFIGTFSNRVTVLSKGTLIFGNIITTNALPTDVLTINNTSGALTINAGTVSAVSGTNAFMVRIGGSTDGNSLIITNGGNLFADVIGIRSTSSLVFKTGTLSTGGMDIDSGANGSNQFVVGDGIGVAYYDMTANGDGLHGFSNGGLVVTNGAFLRGSGAIDGTVRVLGTFVPGFSNSVGSVVTSNSLSFVGAAVLNYDLGTNSDSVTVNGNLALGSSTLNVTDSGGFGAGEFVLFQHTNTVTAPSGTLTVNSLPAGFAGTVSNDLPNARVLLVVTAIGGGDPYTTWTSFYGLGGGSAAGGADPDGDGMSNTNEFLAGFNPTNSSARLKITNVVRTDGTNVTITYLGASGDSNGSPGPKTNVLDVTTGTPPSYSNNFVSAGQTNVLSGGTGLGQVATFVHTNGATGPARYYRVRVLVP